MKKQTKIFLFALTLTLLIATIFVFGASAEEENAGVVVPDAYSNATDHPIVIFEASTMEVVKTLKTYNELLDYLYNWTGYLSSKYVYLQTDLSGNTYYANTGANYGSHIIDLNGHTFTLGTTLVDLQSKNNKAMGLTFKNGNIVVANKYVVKVHSNGNGAGKVANIAFENINFKNITSGALVCDANASASAFTTNVTFKNCTAEVTGTPVLFQLGNSANASIHVTVYGGNINYKGASVPSVFTNTNALSNQTIVFCADENGEYLKATAPVGVGVGGVKYPTDKGELGLVKISSDDTTVFYQIVLPSSIPGVQVPPAYANESEHPILVFEASTMECLTSFKTYNDLLAYLWNYTGYLSPKKIYLQADLSGTSYYSNTGAIYGSHIIDLNGHTITLGSTLLELQAKSNKTMSLTFQNGNIVVANRGIVTVSSHANGAGKNSTVIFENITFKNITSGHLVKDNGTAPSAVTTNVEFKNCVAEVASGAVLFQLGVAENSTIHAKFVGGKIVYNGTTVPTAYKNTNSLTNQTVEFAKDEEGNFPTICANATIDVTSLSYPTAKGNTYLRKTAESNGVATYTLSSYGFISTYLNLASDLNMVCRVFLPAGSDATVTFLIDGFEKTVAFEGLDENGLYLFKLAGITPAKMNENITATLTVNGETVGTLNYTIKAYLDAVKTQNTSEKTLALVDALLVYGAAAQQYDKGNTEGFDTATVEALATLGAIDKTSISYEKTGTGIEHFAMNLGGTFFLRAGIVVDDATGMTLEVGDKTYNVANYAPDANGIRAIVCDSFTATELDQPVTFTLKQNGEVIGTLTVNANAYLYMASQSTIPNLAPLAKAIYAYGVAAEACIAQN